MSEVVKETGVRKASPKKNNSVRSDLDRISSSSRPWWGEFPSVFGLCVTLAFAPIRYAAYLSEIVLSLVFLAFFGFLGAWWLGIVEDAVVIDFLVSVGDRVLGIIQKTGALS